MNILKEYLPVRKDPKYLAWHDERDLQMQRSAVLNREDMIPNVHGIVWDRQGLQVEIIARVGFNTNEIRELAEVDSLIMRLSKRGDITAGMFRDGEEWRMARLPYLKSRLQDTEQQYKEICRRAKLQGFQKPGMPKHLFDEVLRWKARIWVAEYEVVEISKYLAKIAEVEKIKVEKEILKFGIGSGTKKLDLDGCLVELHGQQITYVTDDEGEEIPVIANGPLKGLSVSDYRSLCQQHKADKERARKEKLKSLQERCRVESKPVPETLPVEALKVTNQKILFPKDKTNWLSTV